MMRKTACLFGLWLGIVIGVMIFYASFSSAWTNTTFNNSLSLETATFTTYGNITRWLNIPSIITAISTARMNVSGFVNEIGYVNDTADVHNAISGEIVEKTGVKVMAKKKVTVVNITFGNGDLSTNCYIEDKDGVQIATATVTNRLCSFPYGKYNLTKGEWYYFYGDGGGAGVVHSKTDPAVTQPANRTNIYFNSTWKKVSGYEEAIWRAVQSIGTFDVESSIPEASFDIGIGSNFANTTISTNGTTRVNISVSGLVPLINSYLATCVIIDGFCQVPFLFRSLDSTGGQLGYYALYFSSEGMSENSQSYNNMTVEGSSETFSINITYDTGSYLSSTAYLVYNGTSYAGTKYGTGNNIRFSKSISIPSVTSDVDKNFHWELQLYNGTSTDYFNSTFKTQRVLNLGIDSCGTNKVAIYNFFLKDEDTGNTITPSITALNTTIEVELSLYDLTGGDTIVSFNRSFNNTNPASICIDQNMTSGGLRADGTVKYFAQGYVDEYYTIQNVTLSNLTIPQNITLYDLLTTSSQSFVITYKDSNFLPLPNVLVDITRKYVSEGVFKTVELPKTDQDGRTIGHFVTEDAIYTIYVKSQGRILATFQNVRVVCSNVVTGDCQLELKGSASTIAPSSFQSKGNMSYLFSYNDTSRQASFTFSSTDSASRNVELDIFRWDLYNNLSLCTTSLSSTSGTLICTIPAQYQNSSAIAKIYVDGELFAQYNFDVKIDKGNDLNPIRYILAFIIVCSLPMFAFTSGVMMLLMFIVSLVLVGWLVLVDWGGWMGVTSAFLWFVVVTILLIWKATRRREYG